MDARPQTGQGATEFLLAAVPVLLVGLGSIEALHWYFVRQALSLALEQAARSAIVHHADPARLDAAFSEALLGLYAGASPHDSQRRLKHAIEKRERALSLPAWRLRILSPSLASFSDFRSTDPELARDHYDVIDNDHLDLQHASALGQGWRDGKGPASGQTILEANTLMLHLTWLHEPLLPGVRQLLKQIAPADARYGATAMARGGYLPIQRQLSLVMQSHPVSWPMPSHGRVHRIADSGAADERQEMQRLAATGALPWDTTAPLPPVGNDPDHPASGNGPGNPYVGPQGTVCTGLWCLAPWRGGNPGPADTRGPGTDNWAPPVTGASPPAQVPAGNNGRTDDTGSGEPPTEGSPYLGAVDGEGEGEGEGDILPDADACPGCCEG
jgi:hypothetical protein